MSKASARHSKRGVDNRKFAAKLATKKELNKLKQYAAYDRNLAELQKLGIKRLKGETPSRALRRYRREQDGIKLSEARQAEEARRKQIAAQHQAFLQSLAGPGPTVDAERIVVGTMQDVGNQPGAYTPEQEQLIDIVSEWAIGAETFDKAINKEA